MRAALFLLAIALAATPALAQQKVAAPKLRGSLSTPVQQPGVPAVDPVAALPPLLAPLASAPQADASRCRLTCASSYYFCLATESPEECPTAWGQCRASCDAPSPVQVVSSIPAAN